MDCSERFNAYPTINIAKELIDDFDPEQEKVAITRMEKLYGVKFFDTAEEMYDWGVISYLVDDDKFEDFVHEKASWLGKAATNSLFVIKKCIDYGTQVPLNVGLQFEQLGYAINSRSKDVYEGVSAFLEKSKPMFKGE